ncbi:MAG TPA: preprotein translocase subunit SecE [Candidatus Eisenbergiella merdavium]|uniref:Protein translocase subunit SecE n=1 Tax=Candidatus Eisenbergiella merdavium TaxID=2838551 RepID=A0A9D2SPP8_9FIRM|nr:preprotein translocase subunit SecE [Candidatus Eisenbergiella merdavium]
MKDSSKEAKAARPAKPKFFQGVKAEFRKITWPDRELLLKQSVAVVAISIVLGAIIAVLDLVLQYAIDFLVR